MRRSGLARSKSTGRALVVACLAAVCLAPALGCRREAATSEADGAGTSAGAPNGRVVLYTSVDDVFARDIVAKYRKATGADVALVTDSEAGKTTGLVQRIVAEGESGRGRADVFWSGEIFATIQLARQGLLAAYESPSAADIAARFRDGEHRWTATAVRPRVIAFDPQQVSLDAVPTTWEELADAKWAGSVAIANPLFGTTRGHVAAMFALWGPERAKSFLTRLRDGGAFVADGNSATVRAVMSGRSRIALTDSDDVWMALRSGAALEMRGLDMGDGGTLLIPCTAALLKHAPNPESGRRLIDFLVSAEVERLLAESDSKNIPVREGLRVELGIEWPAETKVDWYAVADALAETDAAVRDILLR